MPTPTINSGLDLRQLLARGERVFHSHPQVARYFPAATIEDARQRLSRSIDRGDGPGLVIGAPGTGKSLLLQILAAQYHERFDVVLLAVSRLCTRRALLQAILFELGLPYRLRDEGQLRLSLLDHLLSAEESPAGLLLLIDEAQAMPVALFDELRVMTNLVRGGVPRVRVVLAGSAALEESFAQPELESFSQRLAARCYLAPFNREETCQFIRAQVAASGGAPDLIFTADAATPVFDATDGVPRLVAQLCDRALFMADEKKQSSVDRDIIQAAWADLQQLPTPWNTPAPRSTPQSSTSIVEFGDLDLDNAVLKTSVGGVSDADTGSHTRAKSALEAPPAIQSDILSTHESDSDPAPHALIDDIEATELDEEEAVPAAEKPLMTIRHQRPERVPGDPFAEKFDEEEVVLDNFAAWEDMFHRATPRVENHRDPAFASLVQAAIDASPVSQPAATLVVNSEVDETADENLLADRTEEPASVEPPADWRPLRLAVVSDPAPLKAIPLVAPSATISDGTAAAMGAFDPVYPDDTNLAQNWPSEVAARLAPRARPITTHDTTTPAKHLADPILVIEDDLPTIPASKPPVRREEYRHLFSRLRSG